MEYKIGMVVTGKVTGIQPYGAFVMLDDETQGLIHISECKHGYTKDLNELLTIDETIEVMILDIDEYTKKISLSLRTMQEPKKQQYHPTKRRHRHKQDKIGFQSIREALPKWIEQAKRDEKEHSDSK